VKRASSKDWSVAKSSGGAALWADTLTIVHCLVHHDYFVIEQSNPVIGRFAVRASDPGDREGFPFSLEGTIQTIHPMLHLALVWSTMIRFHDSDHQGSIACRADFWPVCAYEQRNYRAPGQNETIACVSCNRQR
jgi:hypothetical protein